MPRKCLRPGEVEDCHFHGSQWDECLDAFETFISATILVQDLLLPDLLCDTPPRNDTRSMTKNSSRLRLARSRGRSCFVYGIRCFELPCHAAKNQIDRNKFGRIHAFFISTQSFCIHHRCRLHKLTLQYAACTTKLFGRMRVCLHF
jgi:hypothetical protein